MHKIFFYFILLLLVLIFPKLSFAQDIKTDYQTEYFLNDNNRDLETKVKLNVKITYLSSDVLAGKFTLFFTDNFNIHNISAKINNETVSSAITPMDKKIKIEIDLSKTKIGKGSKNDIMLEFYQDNLFKISGNVWEVILPNLNIKDSNDYRIIVNLPKNTDKKISISKPKPDLIRGSQIIWENTKNKTIYAVFGDKQIYNLKLDYHLKNPDLLPVYNYIALPPDTLYQKIIINNLDPKPVSVETDADGNYLAKYLIKPKEVKKITFDGAVEVFAQPRGEIIPLIRDQMQKQDEYLLTIQKYWQVTDSQKQQNLKTPNQIFDFVTSDLKYNYNRAAVKDKRLGADKILKTPDQATCVDFTDLFVALAREKGIKSREIEGYGFSQNQNLRPISTNITDVLHAWPEYYDNTKNIWTSLDPTWENTSGIDYFNSFDLNHIAFVIHGKDPEYPLPAGMYKVNNTKDVNVNPTKDLPREKVDLLLENHDMKKSINDKDTYKGRFTLRNNSNVYLWNFFIESISEDLNVIPEKIQVDSIPPFASKEIEFSYKSKLINVDKTTNLTFNAHNKQLLNAKINVVSIYLSEIKKIMQISLITIFLIGFVIILRRVRVK